MLAAAAAMVGLLQTAQAQLASESALLSALEAQGGSLTVGDKTFSDFSYNASLLPGFSAAGITVTATEVSANYYTLTWNGTIQVSSTSGLVSGDLVLGYVVAATGGAIGSIDQSYTGGVLGGVGSLGVTENAYTPAPNRQLVATSVLTTTLTSENPPNTYTTTPATILIVDPPQSVLDITKDISINVDNTSNTGLDTSTISVIEQSFEEVPEATTLIAGALLVLPFGASALRILRRNRMA
jgi:hypothetical protein